MVRVMVRVRVSIFLQAFRLPGEAQKIDRMMEAFAAAYFAANSPGVFENADGAYVLAFSIIMLNTDRHSPNMGKNARMTVEGFLRNNRGINNGKDLPAELLEAVFKSISENEIKMLGGKEELSLSASGWRHIATQCEAQRGWSGGAPPAARRLTTAFGSGLEAELLRTLWQPTLAALSALIEASQERGVLTRALRGFDVCSRVAAQCVATDLLDALAVQLARLSTLLSPPPAAAAAGAPAEDGAPPPRPFSMQPKAMLAAAALCRVAREHGHALRAGWEPVVQVLLGLHDRRLLPASLGAEGGFELPGSGGGAPRADEAAQLVPPHLKKREASASSFSFFGGLAYLIGAGGESEADEARADPDPDPDPDPKPNPNPNPNPNPEPCP